MVNTLALAKVEEPKAIVEGEFVGQATHGSTDHPLRIGEHEIPCYVLQDEKRVIVLSGMLSALDMSLGSAGRGSGNRLTKFISGKALRPFIPDDLAEQINSPLRFRTTSGVLAYGYEATVISDLCNAVIEASKKTKLNYQLDHIIKRAEILQRGFQQVGLIALIDEATGYQEFRVRDALEIILQKFISNELMKWAKTFPDEFYRQMFRLKGWVYNSQSNKRTAYAGSLTNDLVYRRLAPGILEELQRVTPKDEKGRRKHRYHQRLTEDVGHPRLREHLASVITLMRASNSWNQFSAMLDRALPIYDVNLTLALPFEDI